MKFTKINMNREYDYDEILEILCNNNNSLYKYFKRKQFVDRVCFFIDGVVLAWLSSYLYKTKKKKEDSKEVTVDDIFEDVEGKPIA